MGNMVILRHICLNSESPVGKSIWEIRNGVVLWWRCVGEWASIISGMFSLPLGYWAGPVSMSLSCPYGLQPSETRSSRNTFIIRWLLGHGVCHSNRKIRQNPPPTPVLVSAMAAQVFIPVLRVVLSLYPCPRLLLFVSLILAILTVVR